MLAMMLNAIAIHAQEENSIQQLMDYLEQHHPKEIGYSLGRTDDRIYEERSWKKGFDIRKDRPIVRYQLQLLKDTVMQHFLNASSHAVACHHRQTPKGTEDEIDYALALAKYPDETPLYAYGSYHNHALESATFHYRPDRDRCNLAVEHSKTTEKKSSGQALDYRPLIPFIAQMTEAAGGEQHRVSYRYNTQKENELYDNATFAYVLEQDSNNMVTKSFIGGDRVNVIEGGCSGTLYIIPQPKADAAITDLNREILRYLHNNMNKEFCYDFFNPAEPKFAYLRLSQWGDDNSPREYGILHGKKDDFGRYTILFIDQVDSTFTLPKGYETMLTYDHGKVEFVPDYEKLKAEHPETKEDYYHYLSLLEKTRLQLGIEDLGYHDRTEIIGGDTLRQIFTWQKEISRDSIDAIRSKLINGSFSNFQHVETHTAQGDTIELTASDISHDKERIVCKMYGKGNTHTLFVQQIITISTGKIPEPYNTQWVNDFIQQMKDSARIAEYPISYEYGKKSDPSSMGKVSGRLYVLTVDGQMSQANTFLRMWGEHEIKHPNQTFHLVEEVKDQINYIRITDRILARISNLRGEFQLLCIDHVEGKFLIPEEWHRIINYRYGKKTYRENSQPFPLLRGK